MFVFHDVTNNPSQFANEYGIYVSNEKFYRQVSWIKSNFTVIHPAEIMSEEKLPPCACVISFDDGFLGTFDNGLSILEDLGLPSIVFLNMQPVLEGKPILSATASFLDRYVPDFSEFAQTIGLSPPFHLTLTPTILKHFENRYGHANRDAILHYQGEFADFRTLEAWDGKHLVAFGNHLFDHWNACALNENEFEEHYNKNEAALSRLKNRTGFFAFTNGQPKSCYTENHIKLLNKLGSRKIFSAAGGINSDARKFCLERLALEESDDTDNMYWFRVGRGALKSH